MDDTRNGWRYWLAMAALALALFGVLWFALAALGTKFGLWGYETGLGVMTIGVGPMIALAAIALSVLAIILGLTKAPRTKPVILGLAGLLIGGLMFGRIGAFAAQAGAVPPIHDIQTDWEDPILFSDALMAAREAGGAQNPVEPAPTLKVPDRFKAAFGALDGRLVSEIQEEAERDPTLSVQTPEPVYPALNTLRLDASPADVFEAAARLVDARGWQVVTRDPDAGLIEATESSGWFGFEDDVAIRIRQGEDGRAEVDLRSTSRVGLSDLGANAKRVDEFLLDLQREVV